MTSQEIRKKLLEPFAPEKVHWRIREKLGTDHAYVLAYIDARDVMDRLDEVFEVGKWERNQQIVEGNHISTITIHFWDDDHEYWRIFEVEDVAEPTDIEAQKGGASDSFKRAAVNLGIARVLYTLGNTKVKLENGYIPEYEKKRLREEVLIPAYRKFAEEYGLDSSKWVIKENSEQKSEISDEFMESYLLSKRKEMYEKLVTITGPNAASVIESIAAKAGKWATLDILGRVAYIQYLAEVLGKGTKAADGEVETKSKKKLKPDIV